MHYNEHEKSSMRLPANKVEYRCFLPVLARDTTEGLAMV
jgi:hypothetical protein